MSKKRLEYMDMVKGVGILGIVVMHSTTVPLQAIWWLSSAATPLFFLSSGMLIGYTKETEKKGRDVLGRKARSLLLPFFSFSLLYILRDLIRVFMGISDMEEVRLGLNDMVTLWGSSVLWFLPALFLAESMFIFLRKMFGGRKYVLAWTALSCLFLTIVSFLLNDALKPLEGFFLSRGMLYALLCVARTVLRAVYALPFVCTGFLLFETGREFWEGKKEISSALQLAGGIVLFFAGIPISVANGYFDFRSLSFGETPVLFYLAAVLSFTGTLFVCKSIKPLRTLKFLGKNSLIIMATHIDFYFLYIGLNLANRLNGFIPGWNRVFFFVNVIGTMLLLEVLCIVVINRFFPFLSGRGRSAKRNITDIL